MSKSANTQPKPGGHSKMFAMVAVVGIAAAFFLATYLTSFITAKADLTENKIYTVSEGTKEVLADLPVEVKLRYYVSSEKDGLPPRVRDYARRFGDLLREYESLSGGKLKVEQLDPSPDTDEEDSAIADGVSPSVDQFSQTQYYFSVVLTSLGQIVALPPVDQVPEPTLEYLLTKAINEVSTIQDSKPKLTVVSGVPLGGSPMGGGAGYYLFAELSRRFSINYVEPTASSLVDLNIDGKIEDPAAVIVVHPHNISEEMEFELDQYVLRGGRLLAFVDPAFYFAPRGQQPQFPGAPPTPNTPQKSDLPNLFKAWGVNYSPDRFVADMVYKTAVGMPEDTPVVLTLSDEALSPDDPVISQISNAFLVLAGSLDGKAPEKINREILLRSSPQSKLVVDRMDPSQLPPNTPPQPSLRILHPEANQALVTGFQAGSSEIIPRTSGLNEPGIVGAVSSPDVPRKLVITTRDVSGGNLAGAVALIGTGTDGETQTERVVIEAGKSTHFTKNVFASVTSVSHDFGKSADEKDTLDIAGVGVEHPIAIRLSGKFATAFPDGRPDPAPPTPGPGGRGFPPGGPGFSIPGAPGVEGEQGEDGAGSEGAAVAPDTNEPDPERSPPPAAPGSETADPEKEGAPAADPESGTETKPETPDTPAGGADETTNPKVDQPETAEPKPGVEAPETGTETPDPKTETTEPPEPPVTTPDGDKGEPGKTEPPSLPPVDPPAEPEIPKLPELKEATKEGVVVVVADVDMINNQFTSTVERRLVPPGNIVDALVPNRQFGNLSFALNVIEQLTGDTRLLAVRSRSVSSRPFTRIQEIEAEANKEMLAMEAEAQKDIQKFVAELQDLEREKGSDDLENQLVVQKQEEKIQSVNAKLVSKRKELREMQKAKKAKTETLVAKIKAWNILAVPLFVMLIGLLIAIARRFTTAAR